MKRIIHVNQHVIKKNRKLGGRDAVITCKTYKDTVYGSTVQFTNGTVVYRPERPLSCGAEVWIETEDEVKVFTPCGELIVL
jgi:hypothetical protein